MWKCNSCSTSFEFPEIKIPDAGPVSGTGILGMRKIRQIKFCPECMSTKICKKERK